MARSFKIIDRNLIGQSLSNRAKKWQLSEDEKRGHPMVTSRGPTNSDYLRRSSVRYFSWEGSNPGNYKNFGYLSDVDLNAQGSAENTVGFNIDAAGLNGISEIQSPYTTALPDPVDDYPPLQQVRYIVFDKLSNYGNAEDGSLVLAGANIPWTSVSDEVGVSAEFRELFNEPYWTNWQAYVLGGSAVVVDDDDTPQRQFYGLFGDLAQTEYYLDHQYSKNLPSRDEVSVSINYNYYNSFFDEMVNNSSISEIDIPNFYIANSIAHNGQEFLHEGLYQDDNASRNWVAENIILSSVGPIVGPQSDYLQASQIPIGQYQISTQTPNSILSRFSRKDFSEDLTSVRKLNRHLGFEPEMMSNPDSVMTDISGRQSVYPYSAEITFPMDVGGTDGLLDIVIGNVDKTNEALSFFLFEIMKANILNFDTGSYDFYQKIDFSAVETDDDKFKYYGFDWTNRAGPWLPENNPEALQPYKVNAIDLNNLFKSIFDQEGTPYGSATGHGEKYYGFVNQVDRLGVTLVDGTGSIVGQKYYRHPSGLVYDGDYNVFQYQVISFLLNLGDNLNDEFRTFEHMLEGDDAYNKTLVYKLDKHKVNSTTGQPLPEPIQSLYFPNVGGVMNYIDTQVKFGERYLYKAYSYDLVVGNQYRYTNAEVFPPTGLRYPNALAYYLYEEQGQDIEPGAIYISPPITITNGLLSWPESQIPDTSMEMYVDLIINGEYVSAPILFPGPGANSSPGTVEKYASAMTQRLEDKINELIDNYITSPANEADPIAEAALKYFTKFRVRRLTLQDQNAGFSRFFIAQVADLVADGYGSQGQIDVVDAISIYTSGITAASTLEVNSGPNAYEAYFDIGGGVSGADQHLDVTIALRSGQHGILPEFPWDLSRLGEADVEVQNYKSVKILELPYFETNVFEVVDLPPQFPDVDIVPLKGESKRIKILLNENATKNRYLPIILEDTDEQKFEEIRIGQGKEPGEALLFGSDDSILSFQVYRVDAPPTTYRDFAGQRRYTLETTTPAGRSITTAAALDNVEPNVAYYYCFRTIDKNGFVSVPSPILKVQMVDDNGRVYPIVEPYDLPAIDTRKAEKTFRRYLEIDTSLGSKTITGIDSSSDNSAGDPLSPPSGVSLSGSVWAENTTFKVRITSKDTGRKIDLNLNFNVEGISNPNLQDN
jgi:hypothetical protein